MSHALRRRDPVIARPLGLERVPNGILGSDDPTDLPTDPPDQLDHLLARWQAARQAVQPAPSAQLDASTYADAQACTIVGHPARPGADARCG